MKLLYLANVRLPTEKAHGIQIMKTCEALAKAGVEVELAVSDRATSIQEDPFSYYGIRTPFTLKRLKVIDLVYWGKLGFIIESLTFAWAAKKTVKQSVPDVVFGRDEFVLSLLSPHTPIVWETHTGAWTSSARKIAARAHKIIAISQGLKDFYVEHGVDPHKIVVVHDGVDLEQFNISLTRQQARAQLGINPRKPMVVYTGSQYARKGVAVLRAAAEMLSNIELCVVSGEPYARIPLYLRAADLLVIPNSGNDLVSAKFTSPMKLFEYMASGTPLVASDIPSLREVLDESLAVLVAPDNPQALADGIGRALEDPASPTRAAEGQKKASVSYTWDVRARAILASIV